MQSGSIGHEQRRPARLNHPSHMALRQSRAQRCHRGQSVQHIPHRAQPQHQHTQPLSFRIILKPQLLILSRVSLQQTLFKRRKRGRRLLQPHRQGRREQRRNFAQTRALMLRQPHRILLRSDETRSAMFRGQLA